MGLYSKGCYFASNFVYTLPSSTLMLLAYALPASSLAVQKHNLIFYIAIMLGECFFSAISVLTKYCYLVNNHTNSVCVVYFLDHTFKLLKLIF